MTIGRFVLAAALACALTGCQRDRPRAIIADERLNVLENPWPLNYPSTNPKPNGIVRTASPGERMVVVDRGYEKDYMYYEVRMSDGKKGFIIAGAGASHEER